MIREKRKNLTPSREIAYVAVMCALLIGGQYAFSFVIGVEIVTLLLACFSYVFGVRCGVVCAAAFALLRCFIYGFYPSVVLLYLIYYPFLAAVFGGLGKVQRREYENHPLFIVALNVVLLGLASACVCAYAFNLIKISRIYQITVHVFLWIIFGLCLSLCAVFDWLIVLGRRGKRISEIQRSVTLATVAAVCTILFSLIDDVLTPLLYGFTRLFALTYFYGSFLAMLPQTVCSIVTVGTLFMPLSATMRRAARL